MVTPASVPATAHFSVSSTGTLVYVPGPASLLGVGAQVLAIFGRNGPGEALKLPAASYSAPRVSPDGKWVAFEIEDERESNVWVYELAGAGAARRLTFGGKNRAPIWSGDSQWVAFQSDREGDFGIFRQRADGAGPAERLTKTDAAVTHTPQSWSPDGGVILFTVVKDQQSTLSVLTLKERRISAFPTPPSSTLVEAAFSPDGRWVAYQSRESGVNATYLQPFPPTGAKYLLPRAGGQPYWSRKGDEITVNIGPGLSARVPVTTSPRLDFGPPEEFTRPSRSEPNPNTTRRNVDALPDGRVLGVTSAVPQTPFGSDSTPQIIVVLNWFDEIRQRVPAADGRR
jgi:dipeptidyl aminopeptidase/acylaminoacyl peptidase